MFGDLLAVSRAVFMLMQAESTPTVNHTRAKTETLAATWITGVMGCDRGFARGERHGMAKLTEQNVRDIRANYALCRVTQAELAARFGVAQTHVSAIVRGKLRGQPAIREGD